MSDNTKKDYPLDSWSQSELKQRLAWKIENFSVKYNKLKSSSETLLSSKFTIHGPDNKESRWRMRLMVKGENPEAKDYIFVGICNVNNFDVTAGLQYSILDSSKNIQNTFPENVCFNHLKALCETSKTQTYGCAFVKHSTLTSRSSELLPNDSLTVVCDITILGAMKSLFVQDHSIGKSEAKEVLVKDLTIDAGKLSQDLETAYMNKELTDVQLQCGDKTFDCHQFMLSARSPVFRAMFQADMREKETKKVDLVDLDPVVVAEMLHFIYTGETNKMKELAEELLAVADRYQIENLQTLCEEFLCSMLKVDNCIELLVKGDLHYAKNLKRSSLKFISRNRDSFSKSRDWKDTLKNYPELMVEVIEQLFKEP